MPTPVWIAGFEDRVVSILQFGSTNLGILDDLGAGGQTIDAGGRNGYALRLTASAGVNDVTVHKKLSINNCVFSGYFKIVSMPDAGTLPWDLMTFQWTAGFEPWIRLNRTSGRLQVFDGTNQDDFGPVISTGTWYRIDMRHTSAGAIAVQVDGGTEFTSSPGAPTTPMLYVQLGSSQSAATVGNWDIMWDDVVVSETTTDYPMGAHKVLAVVPTGDGTHGVNAAGDMRYNAGAGALAVFGSSVAYTGVDEWPAPTTQYVEAVASASTEYSEHTFPDTTESAVWGVQGTMAGAGSTANPCNLTVRIVDSLDATLTEILPNVVMTTTALNYRSIPIADPGGGGWTVGEFNGLKVRIGFSADVNPDARCHGVLLQYAVPEAGGPIPKIIVVTAGV